MSKTLTPEKIKMIRDIVISSKGGDPNEQSVLKDILKVDYIQEKTNYPVAVVQQKQTYLQMCVEGFGSDPNYGEELKRPFQTQSFWDSVTWRSYKGFTPKNQTEMMKKTTDLSGLFMQPNALGDPMAPQKKRFWNKGKNQGEELTDG